MSKHTPGPWAIDGCGFVMAQQPEIAGPGEELPPEYEVASIGDGSGLLTDRERADARLIAAAPDLLAACEAAVPLLGLLVAKTGSGDYLTVARTLDLVLAAILRAKGE